MRIPTTLAIITSIGVLATNAALAQDFEEGQRVKFEAAYLHDTWSVAHGGYEDGQVNLGKVDVSLAIRGGSVLGISTPSFFARAVRDGSGVLSERYVGDAQGVSNIEALRGTYVTDFWSEWSFGGTSSVLFGLYDLNSEFDSNDTGSLFINNAHGMGPELSHSGENGPDVPADFRTM